MNREGPFRFMREGLVLFRLALRLAPNLDHASPHGLPTPHNLEKPLKRSNPLPLVGGFCGISPGETPRYSHPIETERVSAEEEFREKPINTSYVPASRARVPCLYSDVQRHPSLHGARPFVERVSSQAAGEGCAVSAYACDDSCVAARRLGTDRYRSSDGAVGPRE